MAAIYAKKQKWNDAVLLNTEDRLCDTTIANIFLIRDELIYTPALQEGCIAGIMRKNMINLLTVAGYKITEGKLSANDLLEADEVFLTNALMGIMPVSRLEDKLFNLGDYPATTQLRTRTNF
jgi:branched-subunit amino acid aminotransferase/4-amino-4-deoxychorismate lyase